MRTDFRGLANQRQVDMFDEAVPFCDALRRIFQETGGGDAAPLRVGWREVAAYVSLRQRAEQGVDQGMDGHVRVAMPRQAPVVRNVDAAEPEFLFGRQPVNVISHAGSDAAGCAQPDFGAGKVFGIGQFFQPFRSEEHTSELKSLMRNSYAVFCLKKTKNKHT